MAIPEEDQSKALREEIDKEVILSNTLESEDASLKRSAPSLCTEKSAKLNQSFKDKIAELNKNSKQKTEEERRIMAQFSVGLEEFNKIAIVFEGSLADIASLGVAGVQADEQ